MSYTPTEWNTGDIVTAEKLNNLESGVLSASGGGSFVIGVTSENDTDTLDKTWKEIHDAMASGQIAVIKKTQEENIQIVLCYAAANIGDGAKPYLIATNDDSYFAETQNDYPSTDDGSGGGDS